MHQIAGFCWVSLNNCARITLICTKSKKMGHPVVVQEEGSIQVGRIVKKRCLRGAGFQVYQVAIRSGKKKRFS